MQDNPQRKFINITYEERIYGGPEEGGWYYTRVELLACEQLHSDENLQETQIRDFKDRWAHLLNDQDSGCRFRLTWEGPITERDLIKPVYE